MGSESIVLFAVLAPVVFGLLTLWLPRHWIEPRTLLATAGPAVAFALLVSVAFENAPALQAQHDHAAHASQAHAPHPADHEDEHGHGASHHETSHEDPHADHASAAHAPAAPTTGTIRWMPSLQINLAFLTDGLGLFFGLLVSGVGTLIMLYARGYFGRAGPTSADDLYRFYPTLGFFTTAMLGVVLADYTILTLLFWEMTSISSFLLIGWDRYDKHAVKLAMQAFFTTGLGGMGLFGGVLVFGNATAGLGADGAGIWRWSEMIAQSDELIRRLGEISQHPQLLWAFVLMFVGAGTKSAQFPFHYWLPGAMAAPTPVSAFLHSATMVKAGVFLVGRLFPVFAALPLFPKLIIPLGAVTMLYGGVVALQQHDLKRIFAFTTVSQLGLLMAMYGVGAVQYHGQAAIDYDITQIANHAFYKAPLFIAAGAIGHVLSRDITKLNGAFYKAPRDLRHDDGRRARARRVPRHDQLPSQGAVPLRRLPRHRGRAHGPVDRPGDDGLDRGVQRRDLRPYLDDPAGPARRDAGRARPRSRRTPRPPARTRLAGAAHLAAGRIDCFAPVCRRCLPQARLVACAGPVRAAGGRPQLLRFALWRHPDPA